jgi:hypothetical protein
MDGFVVNIGSLAIAMIALAGRRRSGMAAT